MVELSQAEASRLIDLFWLTFNTVNMYGHQHPLAEKSVAQFYEAVERALKDFSEIIIHLDGQRVFCNGHPANPNRNLGRLVERMNSAGILSINFLSDLKQKDLSIFFQILIDRKAYPRLETMNEALNQRGISGVSLNAFSYVKVAAGKQVREVEAEENQVFSENQGNAYHVSNAQNFSDQSNLLIMQKSVSSATSHQLFENGEKSKQEVKRKILTIGFEKHLRTKRRLEEEVYRARRYLQPLSVLLVSLEQKAGSNLTIEEIATSFKTIYPVLLSRLRFIDFIGLAGPLKENCLLVILPQTEEAGAQSVICRLQSALGRNFFISFSVYDWQVYPDAHSFLRQIKRQHLRQLKIALSKK